MIFYQNTLFEWTEGKKSQFNCKLFMGLHDQKNKTFKVIIITCKLFALKLNSMPGNYNLYYFHFFSIKLEGGL